MRFPGVVLGFHGCDREVAEAVLCGKDEVRVSNNAHDWLGSGAYFWENNPSRALAWATFLAANPKAGRGKISQPSVIGAIIVPGSCLDLTEQSSLDLVRAAHEDFVELSKASHNELPVNEPGFKGDEDFVKRFLDCAVLNFVHQLRQDLNLPPFDTVRAPFLEGDSLFPGSRLSAKTHVQWCVRDPKESIIGYFRPKDIHATSV